ncbi:DUF6318 family protein [Cellulomonas composti]|nr:DUF6318 family protein [Cellulomonas composti]
MTTASATPAPTPDGFDASVAPVPPDALGGPATKAAAADVARYFLSLFPYVFATGDLQAWKSLSGASCKYCANVVSMVDEMFADGNHSVGGEFEFASVEGDDYKEGEFAVLLRFRESPSQTVSSTGVVVEDFPDTKLESAEVHVVWDGSGWAVDGVVVDLLDRQ